MRETVLAMLRHHPFVAEFEPRHLEKLATLAKEIRFERDQILFREGDECSEFYLIVTGLVALEIAAPGHTFRVQTLFAGDELGWASLPSGCRRRGCNCWICTRRWRRGRERNWGAIAYRDGRIPSTGKKGED